MVKTQTPQPQIGWEFQDFYLYDVVKGFDVKVLDCFGKSGILIAFICNHCPYVKEIIKNFVQDAKRLQDLGFGVTAVMSNDFDEYPEDSPQKMKEFAKANNFSFPYLLDKDQKAAKAYDAVCTPDFFGFNKKKELQYRGCLINKKTGESDLLSAMLEIADSGLTTIKQVPSIGCSIKWKKLSDFSK